MSVFRDKKAVACAFTNGSFWNYENQLMGVLGDPHQRGQNEEPNGNSLGCSCAFHVRRTRDHEQLLQEWPARVVRSDI